MSDIVPCFGILGFFTLLFGFIAYMRYLSYRETLALAEKGLVKPPRSNGGGKGALVWGVILTAVGLALFLGLWPLGMLLGTNIPLGFGPWMLAGLLPIFFGLALILIHVLTREKGQDHPEDKNQGKI